MKSPFPGMDPYLEHPALWPGFHARLIYTIGDLLAPALRPRYWIDIEERLYLEIEDLAPRVLRPDLTVSAPATPTSTDQPRGADVLDYVAVAEAIEMPEREGFLVIRDLASRQVITVIEVLSPTNKAPGAKGHGEYLRKRTDVLGTETSLVEIDLLRNGMRPPFLGKLSPHDYLVLVHRGWEHPRAWARGWRLRDPIPSIAVPLRRDEEGVALDLAHAVSRVYERGGYDAVLDYGCRPEPDLGGDDGRWLEETLTAAQRRVESGDA